MNPILTNQRSKLMLALACLNTIESAEAKIKVGRHVRFNEGAISDALSQYAETITSLFESAMSVAEVAEVWAEKTI